MIISIPLLLFFIFFHENSTSKPSNYTAEKYKRFRGKLRESKNVLVITGPGLLVNEGLPTYDGISKIWKDVNLNTFEDSASSVWEYFQFKRSFIFHVTPNKAFFELADFESRCHKNGRKFTLITQNIDELHQKAGSKNVLELHGSIFKTKCTVCGHVEPNYEDPICPSLKGKIKIKDTLSSEHKIPHSELPRCKNYGCNGLLRPILIDGFNETLNSHILERIDEALENCDICLLFGTSPMISLAIKFGSNILQKRLPVAGFNIVEMSPKPLYPFYFSGPITRIVKEALSV